MIVNPKKIVEQRLIENLTDNSFEIQQNGIDITLGEVKLIVGGKLGKNERVIGDYIPVVPDNDGYILFEPGNSYSIDFQQKIRVPDDMCAQIVQRSTLNRMGAFILSGVYDSGFENTIGAVLRTTAPVLIQVGARVAQIVFSEADPASLYDGVYQGIKS